MGDKTNKNPSFPPNYVTLVQLRERWLKEKERKQGEEHQQREEDDRKQKQSQLEDRTPEAQRDESVSKSPTHWGPRRRDEPEASMPEVEVAGDDDGSVSEEKTTTKKKQQQQCMKGKSQRRLGPTAEDQVAGKEVVEESPLSNVEKDEVGGGIKGEIWAESGDLDRSVGFEADSGVSSAHRGVGKRSYWSKTNGKRKSEERRKTSGAARAESDNLNEKTDLGPKSRVLPVKVVIGEKDDELLRRKGDVEKQEVPARRNRGKRTARGEARAESDGLDRSIAVETQVTALSVNSEIGKKNGGKSGKTRGEARTESDSLDWVANIEPGLRALAVSGVVGEANERLRRNGRKEDRLVRRKQESTKTRGESRQESNELDQTADSELKVKALPVNGWVQSGNGGVSYDEKEDGFARRNRESRKTGGETRSESNELDRIADIEHRIRALSVNGRVKKVNDGLRRNGEKGDRPARRNQKIWKAGGETRLESNELDQMADIEHKVGSLSVNKNDGLRRSDEKDESRGTGVETRLESSSLDQMNDIKLEVRTLSVNRWAVKGNGGLRGTSADYNHGHKKSRSSAPGRFSRQEVCRMVWVKKGEANGDNVGGD